MPQIEQDASEYAMHRSVKATAMAWRRVYDLAYVNSLHESLRGDYRDKKCEIVDALGDRVYKRSYARWFKRLSEASNGGVPRYLAVDRGGPV